MLSFSPEMLSLLYPLLWGATFGVLVFTGIILKKWWLRRQQEQNRPSFELTPNCLLTRIPVLLLTEPDDDQTSRKHHNKQANKHINKHRFEMIYQMLTEHGYKTEWVKIPIEFETADSIKKQIQDLLQELAAEELSFHVFVAPELLSAFSQVVESAPAGKKIAVSITALEFPNPRKVLDRAVELAEQDFIGPHQANS